MQFWSHLLQMRGLKLTSVMTPTQVLGRIFYRCVDWNPSWSRITNPLIGRIFYRCVDWNFRERRHVLEDCVASFTDAWIETRNLGWKILRRSVASFTDAWIETFPSWRSIDCRGVASFTDAWIETFGSNVFAKLEHVASFTDAWIETCEDAVVSGLSSRIFYRCVDWNSVQKNNNNSTQVASFTDAWIETS